MNKANIVKVGILSLSSIAVLAGCEVEGAENIDLSQVDLAQVESAVEEVIQSVATAQTANTSGTQVATDQSVTSSTETATQESPGIETVVFEVSLEEAIETFSAEFNQPYIDEIEFDNEDGRYVYDFEGWDGQFEYEMKIDARTGEIIEKEKESETDRDDILDLENILSPQEAMAIALEVSGGRYVKEWTLEVEDGVTVYDVDVEGGEDVDVDARTGEIR
jgi:uncharacterized membrane protein YkoI